MKRKFIKVWLAVIAGEELFLFKNSDSFFFLLPIQQYSSSHANKNRKSCAKNLKGGSRTYPSTGSAPYLLGSTSAFGFLQIIPNPRKQ